MRSASPSRYLAAAGLALAGIIVAVLVGAPLMAALVAAAGAMGALALLPREAPEPPPVPTARSDDRLPAMSDLLQSVDEPMLVVREGRIVMANPGARQLLGDGIEGKDVRLAIRHPAATDRLAGPELSENPGPSRIEVSGLGAPDRDWVMTVTGLVDGSQVVHLADLSQSRAVERMRSDFIADASHELRTPLASLLGFLETLRDEAIETDATTRDRFLGIMFEEASRMRRLVDDLMSLSRVESQRFAAPSERVELLPLIEQVRADLAAVSAEEGSPIEVESEIETPALVGDHAQLCQLLVNLVGNALRYGRAGRPVRIRVEAAGDLVKIRVADEGEGIAPEHVPRLTERFYRVDAGRSRSVGGTGLGLAIAKHIVLRHRGRLDIKSEVGKGTTVELMLPRAV